jgi:hypothetical protein
VGDKKEACILANQSYLVVTLDLFKMKRVFKILNIISLQIVFFTASGFSQNRVCERIYISTDREAYVAGEELWISAYCLNASDSIVLSDLSAVAYLELHNNNSMVISAKVALIKGRGCGNLTLPPDLPTGNYRLVAYTRQMLNESEPVLFEKILSVYNTLDKEKVEGNVVFVKSDENNNRRVNQGVKLSDLGSSPMINLRFGESGKVVNSNNSFPLIIENMVDNLISVNVSVYKIDSLNNNSSVTVKDYLNPVKPGSVNFNYKYIPEYEGEIIRGRVINNSNTGLKDRLIFLSATGKGLDTYSTYIDSLDNFMFFTNSIPGEREVVLQIPSIDSNVVISYELTDPFIKYRGGDIPKLELTPDMEKSLIERGIGMQIGRRFGVDTLFDMLPYRYDPLLNRAPVVYKLDDYTRFTVMPEVMIEFIPELRFRKFNENNDLQVRIEDGYNLYSFSRGNSLVLLDGIPVFDHRKIYNYDPLKVKSISIYGHQYNIGLASYDGIVMFDTYKRDYPGISFSKNVRIIDFKGVLPPSGMTASKIADLKNYPDMRSLLYWNPVLTIDPGQISRFYIHTSSLTGKFAIKIEGVTHNGAPVEYYTEFTVK